jgi:hypothetical protein
MGRAWGDFGTADDRADVRACGRHGLTSASKASSNVIPPTVFTEEELFGCDVEPVERSSSGAVRPAFVF